MPSPAFPPLPMALTRRIEPPKAAATTAAVEVAVPAFVLMLSTRWFALLMMSLLPPGTTPVPLPGNEPAFVLETVVLDTLPPEEAAAAAAAAAATLKLCDFRKLLDVSVGMGTGSQRKLACFPVAFIFPIVSIDVQLAEILRVGGSLKYGKLDVVDARVAPIDDPVRFEDVLLDQLRYAVAAFLWRLVLASVLFHVHLGGSCELWQLQTREVYRRHHLRWFLGLGEAYHAPPSDMGARRTGPFQIQFLKLVMNVEPLNTCTTTSTLRRGRILVTADLLQPLPLDRTSDGTAISTNRAIPTTPHVATAVMMMMMVMMVMMMVVMLL
uniref:Uncharacterized protein n=1 Tax=Anopheles atroparvus TaxID=41427 RepID=A0A182ITP3_ANOAO